MYLYCTTKLGGNRKCKIQDGGLHPLNAYISHSYTAKSALGVFPLPFATQGLAKISEDNHNLEDLCVAWGRNMWQIWKLPQQAHCFLLGPTFNKRSIARVRRVVSTVNEFCALMYGKPFY